MEINLNNFFSLFKKYKIEIFLIIISLIIAFISYLIYSQLSSDSDIEITESENNQTAFKLNTIVVDISGAINKPGVYELKNGSRINDAIKKAQGLTEEADINYFYRNFNLSAYLFDQEKIYIPYIWEINSGIFVEETRILNYLSPFTLSRNESDLIVNNTDIININTCLSKELEDLPGIGQKTAQKVIENRPYKTIDELLSKKIINQNIFENIKEKISVQ